MNSRRRIFRASEPLCGQQPTSAQGALCPRGHDGALMNGDPGDAVGQGDLTGIPARA